MTDSPEDIHGTAKVKKWIADEVKRQITPLNKSVEDVKRQNGEQTRKIDDIGIRLRGLWGNGSGPPGYLETARKEDKEWKDEMFAVVDGLRADKLRAEGKEELRKQQEDECREQEQSDDAKKTNRLARFHYWWVIGLSLAGTWVLHVVQPVLHALMDMLAKAMR